MAKRLICLSTFALASVAAHAQSSVTLYGIIDEGVTYQNNAGGHSLVSMKSGVISGNRWGLRGTEDLGGGYKAVFDLENGFDVNTGALGQGGLEFGRQAYVGVTNDKYGTFTMGRQYNYASADTISPIVGSGPWTPYAAHPGDMDNLNNNYRFNNTVKYVSPTFNGLSFGAQYGFGGVAGQFSRDQFWSGGAMYAYGPLTLIANYTDIRNPNTNIYASNNGSSTTVNVTNGTSPVFSGFMSARSLTVAAAAVAYKIGNVTLDAVYTNTQYQNLGDTSGSGPNPVHYANGTTAKFNTEEVGVRWFVRPDLSVGGIYYHTQGNSLRGLSAAKYDEILLGADYLLSKRTDLYVVGLYQKAGGYDSTGKPAVAAVNSLTASSNNKELAFRVAMRHRF
jgi:predicted porin